MSKHSFHRKANGRRTFIKAGIASATTGVVAGALAQSSPQLEGYASLTSVNPGQTISFFISNYGGTDAYQVFSLGIVKKGSADQTYQTASVSVKKEMTSSTAYSSGCNWPARYQLAVPLDWPSGLYVARVQAGSSVILEIPFVVKALQSSSTSAILVQVPFTTIQAYNNWPGLTRGGKSLYDFNSAGGQRASKVSFNRPLFGSYESWDAWVFPFVRWLSQNGYQAEFCSSVDLHTDPALLNNYQLLITVGHDEYWSKQMRDNVDAFVGQGGNVAIFGGNTCWWQIRFESDPVMGIANRTLVCYKSQSADPTSDPAQKTVNWYDLIPARPENRTIGLSSRNGAIWAISDPRPITPFVVKDAGHWALKNTGLVNGQGFAGQWVGYETDSLEYSVLPDGTLSATGLDGSPRNFRIIAIADASQWHTQNSGAQSGRAILGTFENNGTVFNAGITDWAYGLAASSQDASRLALITKNVIDRLSVRKTPLQKAKLNVYQYHAVQANGDGVRYHYSTSPFVNDGWIYDGPAFFAFNAQVSGTVPVYAYFVNQANGDGVRFLYSTSSTVGDGWNLIGVVFYAYPDTAGGGSPVYQYYAYQSNGDGVRFLYSTLPNIQSGWTRSIVVFYAPQA